MFALTLAVSLQLGAAEARPEAWVVVSRRSGVAKPQALDFARLLGTALNDRGVPTPAPVDDASSCNAKVPCLVDLAQKKGVSVLVTVEAGSALDDVVLHVEALSVEEFGKKLSTFDFSGPAKDFTSGLSDKVEEVFAPAVRNVLGLGSPVAKVTPPPVEEKKPPPEEVKPPPVEEKKPAVVVEQKPAEPSKGMTPVKIAGIVAMGVGVIMLGTSMGLGIKTLGLVGQRNSVCPADQPCTDPSAYDAYKAAGGTQSAGIGTLVAGLILAAGGAVLFFVDLGGGSSATVAPAASSDGMSFSLLGRF